MWLWLRSTYQGRGMREADSIGQSRRKAERADDGKRERRRVGVGQRHKGTVKGRDRCQEAGAREGEWWRLMVSGSSGTKQSAKCECKEEKWQRPDVILSKLLHYSKQKEHRGRGERQPCHRLRSLNTYVTPGCFKWLGHDRDTGRAPGENHAEVHRNTNKKKSTWWIQHTGCRG